MLVGIHKLDQHLLAVRSEVAPTGNMDQVALGVGTFKATEEEMGAAQLRFASFPVCVQGPGPVGPHWY